MSLDQWVAIATIATPVVAFFGLFQVARQLMDGTDQRRMESVLQIYGVNREIISLGFTTPELLQILHGKKANPLVERHYIQLWFNQFLLIYNFRNRKFFPVDIRESLERDIHYFMEESNAQRFWQQNRIYYPEAFQNYIDRLTPPKPDVHEERPPKS
jgi:hypothetical protein